MLIPCRRFTKLPIVAVALLLLLVAPLSLRAQTSRGSISGIVIDPSGAIVSNATVTMVKDGTGATRETKSNDAGLYRFDAVDLGTYTVTVKGLNFAPSVTKNVSAAAGRDTFLSVKLTVGAAESVVTVEGTAEAVLQATEQVRGGTFSARTVQNLPLQGLDSLNTILLNPGAFIASTTSFSNGTNNYTINGARARSNNFMIDGVENNDISVAGPAFSITNQDTVQEVSVQTSNFSSEFGRSGGGVINQVTKSGTKSFHGSVHWLYLSHVFNSTTNDQRIGGATGPDKFVENIPDFTIGGPIFKGKTYFFGAAQFDRFFSGGATSVVTVPTAAGLAFLQGLNAACTAPGTNLALYFQVLSGLVAPTQTQTISIGAPSGACGTGTRTPSLLTPFLVGFGEVNRTASSFFLDHNYLIKIDHAPSPKQSISARWLFDAFSQGPLFNNLPGFDTALNGSTMTGSFTDTYLINSHWTNEFRFNYGRIAFQFPLADPGGLASTLPNFSITSITGFGGATNIPQFRIANNWQYQETMAYTTGKHQFRFGVDILRQLAKQHPPFNERGSIPFVTSGGGTTALSNFIDDFAGGSNAGLTKLFGSADFAGIYYPNLLRMAFFFTDSWRIRQNLTLNLGVRYENFGQPANIFTTPAFTNYDPVDFKPANTVSQDNNNVSPSVGFAWSPSRDSGLLHRLLGDRKTVIRGGYGISYDSFFNNLLSNIAGSSPNSIGQQCPTLPVAQRGCTSAGGTRGTAGWANVIFPTILANPPTALSAQNNLFDPNIRNPYTQHYSFGVQRELPGRIILDVAYVGALGRHLFQNIDMNPRIGFSCTGTSPACPGTLLGRLFPLVGARTMRASTASSNYDSLQVSVRRGYSSTPVGSLSLSGAYTWSHEIDNISEVFGSDSTGGSFQSRAQVLGGDPRIDRTSGDQDRRHRGVISYVWDIRGPKKGVLGQVLGGWSLSGVTQFQTGAPYTVVNGFDRDGDGGSASDRPDISNPNAPITSRGLAVCIGTVLACGGALIRSCPAAGQVASLPLGAVTNCVPIDSVFWLAGGFRLGFPGNIAGRNFMRLPYIQKWDLSVKKTFSLTERFKLEYRADIFNLFNRQNFGIQNSTGIGNVPGRTVSSSSVLNFLNVSRGAADGRTMRMGLKLTF